MGSPDSESRERACSTSLVTYLKCFTKHLKNLLKSFPMVLDRSLQTLVDIKDKSPLKVILEMDFKIFSYKILEPLQIHIHNWEHIDRRESDDMPIQMSQSFTEGSNFSFNGPFTSMDKQRTSPSPSLGSKSSSRSWIKKKIPKIFKRSNKSDPGQ